MTARKQPHLPPPKFIYVERWSDCPDEEPDTVHYEPTGPAVPFFRGGEPSRIYVYRRLTAKEMAKL